MASQRKFHRTVFQVEVLSADPLDGDMTLEDIDNAITTGDCSGVFNMTVNEIVDGLTMAMLLQAQGSDPEFFALDEESDDLDEESDDLDEL